RSPSQIGGLLKKSRLELAPSRFIVGTGRGMTQKIKSHSQKTSAVAGTKPHDSQPPGLRGFLQTLGPGLVTGASDDDPSGIGTYSQAGAQLGYGIGWTMLLTFPLMVAIQEISARVGRVTGRGIGGNVCLHYPAWVLNIIIA